MTAALEGGEWSAARPGRTLPPGKTRYPFYRRLDGPQGRSGRTENLVPTGIRSRIVQRNIITTEKLDVMSNCGPGRKEVVHTRDKKMKGYIVNIPSINSNSCAEWEKTTITLFEWRNASVQVAERACVGRARFEMHCASCNCVMKSFPFRRT